MRIALCLLLLAGCGGTSTTATEPEPAFTVGELSIQAAEGARRMEPVCFAEERCDALDSDCDGTIDETCDGVATGALDVAMTWDGSGSLALVVEGPTEASASDASGECDDATWARSARRSFADLAPGTYRIAVAPAETCEGEGARTASVAVASAGQLLGIWNVTVDADSAAVVEVSVEE